MDQTQFEETAQALQPPPQPEPVADSQEPVKPPVKLTPKMKVLVILVATTLGLLILGLILQVARTVILNSNNGDLPPNQVIVPTPTPKPSSELGQELMEIESSVNRLELGKVELDAPPVNYDIGL